MEKEYVEGLGEIYTFEKSFEKALVLLKQNKAKLISSRDLAYARRVNGDNSDLLRYGSYTKESPIYSKDVSLLVLDSPLQDIKLAKKAVEENRNGEYFKLEDKKLFEKYLSQAEKDSKKAPEKRKVLILPSEESFKIYRNKNWDFARGLFKDQAENYFKFLENGKYQISSIRFYPVSKDTVDKSEAPIMTELWLCRLDGGDRSDLYGYYRNLDDGNRVRGWSASSEDASAKNFLAVKLPYSQREINKQLKRINQLESELAKTKSFFEKLKQ